ncbi:TatD family hydrolase [uncultured Methanobrevibacter sp.]|uniref:TatD family hydrolase n=1 Tax=uncultured Methanobrevibacter sp. TaxID=253161 RepID=UPI0025EE10D6|nr:TatD family hydrolase [uncultured Methanobrevibacter sp.]
MIDCHTHCDSRSSEDFELMYTSGIDTVISCAYYPYHLMNEIVYLNHLERILNYDTKRAKKYGLDLKVALGIHPTNTEINPELIYENLYKYIENDEIIAIGEIGLENLTDTEYEIFKQQLIIADETNTKVIIHTPRKNKRAVLSEIKKVVNNNIDPKLVVIDHINKNVIGDVIDDGYTLGLTVQPQKMNVDEAIDILDNYGFDKFLLNSDMSNKPSDPLSVVKTIRELDKLNYKKSEINKISHENAIKFFNL